MKNKKVIYSAMINGYDEILPAIKANGWDFVMFTDLSWIKRPYFSGWKFKNVNKKLAKNSHFINRWYKMHPHLLFPEYEESIYIDSNILINNLDYVEKRINQLNNDNIKISIPEHPERNCLYDEIEKVKEYKFDRKVNLEKILKLLKNIDYPHQNGLFENNFIWRKHNDPNIINLMEEWWTLINATSKRDQLSLCYLLWKHNIECKKFFGENSCTRNRDDIKYLSHKKSKAQFLK